MATNLAASLGAGGPDVAERVHVSTLDRLARVLGVTPAHVARALRVSGRHLAQGGLLPTALSDRVVRLWRLWAVACGTFGDVQEVARWFATILDTGRTPIELAATEAGSRVVFRALEDISRNEELEAAAFAAVKRESRRAEADLRAECVGIREFACLLGARPSEIRRLVDQRRVLGIPRRRGGYDFPRWQVQGSQIMPGLDQVLHVLLEEKRLSPLSCVSVLVTEIEEDGDLSPLDLLRRGRIAAAVASARRCGDIGR